MHPLLNKVLSPSDRTRKVLRWMLLGLTAFILLTFLFRTPVASWYVHRKIERFNRDNPAVLSIVKVQIRGVASVLVTGISLVPKEGDTLFRVDSAYASVGLLKLLAGRVSLQDVRLINPELRVVSRDSVNNYGFLLHRHGNVTDTSASTGSYAATVDRLARFAFDIVPLSLDLRNLRVTAITGDHRLELHIGRLSLEDHYFRTEMEVTEDSLSHRWTLAGRLDNHERLASFRLYSSDTSGVRIPLIGYKWNAGITFDTVGFSVAAGESGSDPAQVRGYVMLRGLTLDHRRIAAGPVRFDRLAVDYVVNVGENYAEVDSSTRVTFNRIDLRPYLKVQLRPVRQVTFHAAKGPFPAQDLFSSFPEGLFANLDGMKVKGNLSWHLDFFVDLSQPDSLRFETSLDRHGFSVLSYGNADLTKINAPFEYTAYDHDVPVRTFTVGPENPAFRPLDRISPFLRYSVLTSEDGGFFLHRGFLPDAFRESIAQNIKERRFARGGSTISMQLVKNVFLSRNKTVARKIEEALIVWLIENQGLSTKERMYEVYLNLIEWGPLVYGAGEASHYYFAKEPSKLTLAEAIFMASIIPRPRWFKYSFDETGHLRTSNADFYRLVSQKMLNKGWITASDAEKLAPDVELKGPAKRLLKSADSIPADTVFYPEPE